MTQTDRVCRRCSECEGSDHHWLERAGETDYECKHCDAVGDACVPCDGEGCDVDNDACTHCGGEGVFQIRAEGEAQR